MSSCDTWWTPHSAPGQELCHVPAAALCWIVGLYSFSKVPFYLFAQTPSHGFEVCALLGFTTAFRGPKLFGDPVLFLAPHDLMTTAIILTLAVFLTGSFALPINRVELGRWFFPLAVMFALHALPVRGSIPSQLVQRPLVSAGFLAAIACGAGLGVASIQSNDDDGVVLGFYICALTVLLAPVLDMAMATRAVLVFITSGVWPPPPPVLIKETDGVRTIWLPPTEAQWEQQIAHPHPGAGTCFYANLRRRIWVRVDADGFPVVRPLQQRMLDDGRSIAAEEVVVNSVTSTPPARTELQFGGATGFTTSGPE